MSRLPIPRSRQRLMAPPADSHWSAMDDDELKRLRYLACHRGTREADMLVGGFFDAHCASWGADERAWFARLLEEQDADIIAWATGTAAPPERLAGSMMQALKNLDYIRVAR